MAEAVYVLCAATSVLCAALLLRGYAVERTGLLLWASLCFVGLAVNNILLVVDIVVDADLATVRLLPGVAGFAVLVFGLVWEAE